MAELTSDERLAKIEFRYTARLHLFVHLRMKQVVCASSVCLGAVKRHVGIPKELVGLVAIGWRNGDPNAGPDNYLVTIDFKRFAERSDQVRR